MSGCFHVPSCWASCNVFNRLTEQWMFPLPSACLLQCKRYHSPCYHCCCNLTMETNTLSHSSLMFSSFPRITCLLCPTLLLGTCVRYDLTHFPDETGSVPRSHSPDNFARKRATGLRPMLGGRRPTFRTMCVFSPGADFQGGSSLNVSSSTLVLQVLLPVCQSLMPFFSRSNFSPFV